MGSWERQFGDIKSPCHNAPVTAFRNGGITLGICTTDGCGKPVVRSSPITGYHEWLDGKDPETEEALQLVPRP